MQNHSNRKKLFLSNEEECAISFQNRIACNKKLLNLEVKGFVRGYKKKKTMDVPARGLYQSLEKQWLDLKAAWLCCQPESVVLRKIADLRNVAGCFFLKLTEDKAKQ